MGVARGSKEERLLTQLGLLALKGQRAVGDGSPPNAKGLWHEICACTDQVYVMCEAMEAPFRRVCELLLKECEQDPREAFGRYTALEDGGLKDPVRLHEKACDDYVGRFADGVLPEACVTDVLRARAIFTEARRFRKLASVLSRGYRLEIDGKTYRVELLRGKNKFRTLDPTHFRCLLYNLWLTVEWTEGGAIRRQRALCELQVKHRLVLMPYYDEPRPELELRP